MQLKVSGMLWERLYVPGMRIIKFNIAFCTILISFQCFHNIRCMKEGIIWLSTVYGGRTISTLVSNLTHSAFNSNSSASNCHCWQLWLLKMEQRRTRWNWIKYLMLLDGFQGRAERLELEGSELGLTDRARVVKRGKRLRCMFVTPDLKRFNFFYVLRLQVLKSIVKWIFSFI